MTQLEPQGSSMKLIILFCILFLTGCNSFKLGNLIETTALGGVAYATGGVAPALAVTGTSIVANELEPEEVVADIETTEQAVAFVFTEAMYYSLAGFILFLVLTNIIFPYFQQRRLLRRMEYDRIHKEDEV